MDRLECDRMFVAVVEARSFTAAAVKLGASSGQASKLVSRLEAELGVRLLNRTTRAVSETEAGRAYFERVRSILDEIDNLDLAIRNVAQTPRGRLRLTAPLTFGTVELARALNDFAAGYPEIELEVSFSDRVVNLVDEGFDVAVRVGRPADTSLIAESSATFASSSSDRRPISPRMASRRRQRICSATRASSTRTFGSPVAGRFGARTARRSQSR